VSAVVWDAPTPYDPVWLASVQQYPPAPSLNETRLWGWGWVYEQDAKSLRLPSSEDKRLRFSEGLELRFQQESESADAWLAEQRLWTHAGIDQRSDLNIVVVDWGNAAMVNYILASYNVASVGRILTEFLNFLIEEGVSMDDVHLIGHSLGAHVVGIAGAYVKQGPIDTITGLDPALPLFTLGNKDARLDKHDARHVEVIHTCGGYLGF
ncbi:Lipase, partial [Operophtera brumata]